MSDQVIQIRKHLAAIPDLLEEVSHYLTPGSAPIDPTAVRGATIFRIPIVPAIFDLLDEKDKALDDIMLNRSGGDRRLGVLPTLGLWVALAYAELEDLDRGPRVCCEARHHTVAGESGWLAEYARDVIELHPCCDRCEQGKRERGERGCRCGCFVHDIEQLWVELRQACRIRKEYVPRCPDHGGANRIEGVYAESLGTEGPPAWWQCKGCGRTWVHDAEVRRLASTQPPMTLIQMAGLLGKPLRDLYRLRDNNRFLPVGRNKRGAALYEMDHVSEAAKKLKDFPLTA